VGHCAIRVDVAEQVVLLHLIRVWTAKGQSPGSPKRRQTYSHQGDKYAGNKTIHVILLFVGGVVPVGTDQELGL
jgi:hypothetical protein